MLGILTLYASVKLQMTVFAAGRYGSSIYTVYSSNPFNGIFHKSKWFLSFPHKTDMSRLQTQL